MKILSTILLPILLISCTQESSASKADFYVSPTGSDEASGTIDQPFATLRRAKTAIRELKKEGDILVHLRGGRYEISETEVFTLEDSGSPEKSITYAAYPNETPVLSGGKAVLNWKKPTEKIKGLPEISQEKIIVADIDDSFRTLFDNNGLLPRAKSKPFITPEGCGRDRVVFPKENFKEWSNPLDMDIHVRPHHAWIVNILPVNGFDYKKRTLNTSVESTYAINHLHFLKDTPNCWVENAIEELDSPGEWVINTTEKKLYLWPRQTASAPSSRPQDSTVYYPQVNELIRIEGNIDFEGAKDTPVKNLHFVGLTFQHGERYLLSNDEKGLQHDWDMLDKNNALLRLRGTENCEIKDCHFLHSGSGAIRIDLHGINNRIIGNTIEHLGGSGILLAGYGPGTKDVNHNNLIYNNHIHHVGEIYWHSPGIFLWQSAQNRIANNLVHHTNYTSIIISGFMEEFFRKGGRELTRTIRWQDIGDQKKLSRSLSQSLEKARPYLHTHDNIIEQNEIHHAMQKLGDGNAIYIRGAGAGNIIRRNYIHHLIAPTIMQAAIRTDGGQRDTLISENIIYKCTSQGMMLKLNNRFENNIIADIITADNGKSPARGYYLSLREGPMTGATIKRNIFYASDSVIEFINELPGKFNGKTEDRRGRLLARAQDTDTDYNLYYSAKYPKLARRMLKKHQDLNIGKNSLSIDPLFKDPTNGDFTLLPNSPALKLGFTPIDQSKIGLIKDDE